MASAAEAVDEVVRVGGGRSGRLIIGFSTAAGAVPKVRDLIRRFSRDAPDVDLRLVEHDFGDPMAGLLAGTSQVGVVFAPLTDERLTSLIVFEDRMHVALPASHPLADRAELDVDDLVGLPWLRVPAGDSAWTRFWFRHPSGAAATGPEIRTADEWVPAIESGRGVAYTLPTVMDNFPNTEIVTVPVRGIDRGAVLLAWRKDDGDPLVAAFVQAAHHALGPG